MSQDQNDILSNFGTESEDNSHLLEQGPDRYRPGIGETDDIIWKWAATGTGD